MKTYRYVTVLSHSGAYRAEGVSGCRHYLTLRRGWHSRSCCEIPFIPVNSQEVPIDGSCVVSRCPFSPALSRIRTVSVRRHRQSRQYRHRCARGTAIAHAESIMSALLQDLRYGFRMALRSPGFSAVAVLTLAIGIAVNTTVFSWTDMMLLRPIPGVPNSGELAAFETVAQDGVALPTSFPDFRDHRDHLKLLA